MSLEQEAVWHLLRQAGEALLIVDRAGAIRFANESCERLFGYPPGALLGLPVESLVPEPLREAHVIHRAAYLAQPAARPMGQRTDLFARRRDGSRFPVRIGLSHVESGGGAHVLAVVVDTSELLERTRALELSHRELVQATKLAAIGELAGNVAHEVNNPIGIISAKARLLLSDPALSLPERVENELAKIVEQCDRIGHLTRGLLDFARPQQQRREPCDLRLPLGKALTMIAGRTQRGLIQVEERFAPDAPRVVANPNELQQVFLNLLINAADAMPRGGKIVASIAHAGIALPGGQPAVQVAIQDTGHGVPPELRERIFEPFFTTKGAVKGTGLGLAICLGIVRSHGGTIQLDSRPGEGATFTIRLPAA